MKKSLKIVAIALSLILVILILVPLLFKKQIKNLISEEIDNAVHANIEISDISISIFTNFPEATLNIKNTLITNKEPFDGDTLVYINNVQLTTSIRNLISKKLIVNNISVSKGDINLKTNSNAISNYDIVKTEPSSANETTDTPSSDSNITLHIEAYSFSEINFTYLDASSNLSLFIKNFNHKGKGKFSTEHILLETHTSIESLTASSENITYLKKANVLWDANLDINLNSLKIAFKENQAHLNDLQLSFHGYVQPTDNGMLMDLDFDSKGSKFKSLLSLVPAAYSTNFEDVKANGELDFNGKATGLYSDNTVPKFNVGIYTKNASFHYPNLPKGISNITIDTKINNQTGNLDDTQINIKQFDLIIDQDKFHASCTIEKPISNPHVKAQLKGSMHLGYLSEAYPIALEEKLEGTLKFNLESEFTQKAIETENYTQVKNNGFVSLQNMTVETELLPHPFAIKEAYLKLTPKNFILNKFDASTASSDLSGKGTLKNLIGFVTGNKELSGNFSLTSKHFNVFDFLTSEETSEAVSNDSSNENTLNSAIKIPEHINITTTLNAKKVQYDNITLNNTKGTILIKDQKAIFKNTTAQLLGGSISLKGNVDTKPTPSNFNFSMSLVELDIVESFSTLELFSSIAPYAKALNGKISTSLDLTGMLDADFFPEMNTLSGNGLSKLEVKEIDPKKSNALSLLESNFNFVDFKKLDMKKIQTALKFENSSVSFKQFRIASYDGTPIQMEGSHSFENTMNYIISTDIPVNQLGKEATNLLSGLSSEEVNNLKVPIKIGVTGDITKPTIKPDYSAALKAVSGKVIESQKNKLLNSLFKETNKKGDSSTTNKENDLEKAAKNLIKGLFN